MKPNSILVSLLTICITLCASDAYSRGFGGYHAGGFGGYHAGGFGGIHPGGFAGYGAAAYRHYQGGFGVGSMYEGALDGPRGFSGYGTNWSGYRGGYGIGAANAYHGGYNLGYGRAGGLAGYDNYTHSGPWSRGVAGWRGELGTGGGYAHLGYGFSNFPVQDMRPHPYGAIPRLPSYLYGPAGELGEARRANLAQLSETGLPTDLGFHNAARTEHQLGYLGSEKGLTAFDPNAADIGRVVPSAQERIADAARPADAAAIERAGNFADRDAVTRYRSAADLRHNGNIIRRNVIAAAAYSPEWYQDYATAWIANDLINNVWTPAPWTAVNQWFGENWPAVGYSYGDEITYDNGNVNLYGVPIATQSEYTQSAAQLASQGKEEPPKNASWLPLGVYAAVRGEDQKSQMLFQLAVDKAGVIRGNYFNTGDKNVQHVQGAVDKQTQRVAWIVADRPNIIFDTSLYNLTKSECTVLVHFDKGKTEQWTLVHLEQSNP
jgi:hypothetical protein